MPDGKRAPESRPKSGPSLPPPGHGSGHATPVLSTNRCRTTSLPHVAIGPPLCVRCCLSCDIRCSRWPRRPATSSSSATPTVWCCGWQVRARFGDRPSAWGSSRVLVGANAPSAPTDWARLSSTLGRSRSSGRSTAMQAITPGCARAHRSSIRPRCDRSVRSPCRAPSGRRTPTPSLWSAVPQDSLKPRSSVATGSSWID